MDLNKTFNVNGAVIKNYVDIDEYKRGISDLSFRFRMVERKLENIRIELRENKKGLKE